jgi:periplasmic divalent cation tolerance protein
MTDARVVFTTTADTAEAEKIARALVERRLAACVNILPQVRAIYRWQGKVEDATEILLIIKTTAAHSPAVRDAIRELHSYDVPECIALPVADGSPDYLKWLTESVQPPPSVM